VESEHNEVDEMKKGVDSKGEVMHKFTLVTYLICIGFPISRANCICRHGTDGWTGGRMGRYTTLYRPSRAYYTTHQTISEWPLIGAQP